MSANNDTPPTSEIVERLLATDNLPDEIRGIQRGTREFGGGLEETWLEIWEGPPVKLRKEVLSTETVREPDFELANVLTGKLDGNSDVAIQNESGMAVLDSETNQYYKYEYEPPGEGHGYTADLILLGSSPETDFEVTYDGTDTVVGRETHVLTFRPTEDADRHMQELDYLTMWVDNEYWLPLEREFVYNIGDGGLLQPETDADVQDETYFKTETFEEITFETGIEDAKFYPPEDAERVE